MWACDDCETEGIGMSAVTRKVGVGGSVSVAVTLAIFVQALAGAFEARSQERGNAAGPAPAAAPARPKVLWTFPLKSHSFGGAAVADVNGDGILDVAFATYFGDASVHVLSGTDGKEIWSYHDPDAKRDDCYDASCRFADLRGNGGLQLVVPCSSGCRVLAFEAATGEVAWNTFVGEADCIDTPPFVGPVDRQGTLGVVVGTFKSRLHVLKGADGTIMRSVAIAEKGAVQSCPVVMDL